MSFIERRCSIFQGGHWQHHGDPRSIWRGKHTDAFQQKSCQSKQVLGISEIESNILDTYWADQPLFWVLVEHFICSFQTRPDFIQLMISAHKLSENKKDLNEDKEFTETHGQVEKRGTCSSRSGTGSSISWKSWVFTAEKFTEKNTCAVWFQANLIYTTLDGLTAFYEKEQQISQLSLSFCYRFRFDKGGNYCTKHSVLLGWLWNYSNQHFLPDVQPGPESWHPRKTVPGNCGCGRRWGVWFYGAVCVV